MGELSSYHLFCRFSCTIHNTRRVGHRGTEVPAILSTCYNHFIPIVGVGKERRIVIGPW